MSGEYKDDREWSDQFNAQVAFILAPYVIELASVERDTKRATDLVTKRRNIAVRIRRDGYAADFGKEFTLRSKRTNGTETELEKIKCGHGNWIFYAHVADHRITQWIIINLHRLRYHFMTRPEILNPSPGSKISGEKQNKNNDSCFMWFNVGLIGEDIVVARS